MIKHSPGVLPQSLLGKALTYLREQWPKLVRYIENGDWPISNNLCENSIRPFVMGRSLCTSFRNLDKHWDLSFGIVATRAMFACQSRRNRFTLQIARPDLPWGVGHHLLGGQDSLLDQATDYVTGYAKAFRSLEHR